MSDQDKLPATINELMACQVALHKLIESETKAIRTIIGLLDTHMIELDERMHEIEKRTITI